MPQQGILFERYLSIVTIANELFAHSQLVELNVFLTFNVTTRPDAARESPRSLNELCKNQTIQTGGFIITDSPANLRKFLLTYCMHNKEFHGLFIPFAVPFNVGGRTPSLYREEDAGSSAVVGL